MKDRQQAYYEALGESDSLANSTPFIHFMLSAILESLLHLIDGNAESSSEKSSEKILHILALNPSLSAKQLAQELNMSSRMIEKYLAQLKQDGKLKRMGPAKGGSWQVKRIIE